MPADDAATVGDKHEDGQILSLEGGYDCEVTAECGSQCVLMGAMLLGRERSHLHWYTNLCSPHHRHQPTVNFVAAYAALVDMKRKLIRAYLVNPQDCIRTSNRTERRVECLTGMAASACGINVRGIPKFDGFSTNHDTAGCTIVVPSHSASRGSVDLWVSLPFPKKNPPTSCTA